MSASGNDVPHTGRAGGGAMGAAPSPLRGGLVVVSGPSGAGKTTIVNRLELEPEVDVAVTATTRAPRAGERDGIDYHFLGREEFVRRRDAGLFVEWNEVFKNGHLYGSLKAPLEEALQRKDRCYVLEIDVEGGVQLKRLGYTGLWLFIAPPSLEVLRQRMTARGTEDDEAMQKRIAKAEFEMERWGAYDVVVVNNDLERAYGLVRAVLGLAGVHGRRETRT